MGPLAQLFALLHARRFGDEPPGPPPRDWPAEESAWNPAHGLPPRPYRDPEQGGPAPPVNGPLAQMYGGRK